MGLLPDEMARQDLIVRSVGNLFWLDSLSRSAVQGAEGVLLAGEPKLQLIAQLGEVETAGGDDVPEGDGIVEVHERVDGRRLPTFEGAPKQGLDRAWKLSAGDARGCHSVAPGRDTGVGLRVAVIWDRPSGLFPRLPPQLLHSGRVCGSLDAVRDGGRKPEAGVKLEDLRTDHEPHGLSPLRFSVDRRRLDRTRPRAPQRALRGPGRTSLSLMRCQQSATPSRTGSSLPILFDAYSARLVLWL